MSNKESRDSTAAQGMTRRPNNSPLNRTGTMTGVAFAMSYTTRRSLRGGELCKKIKIKKKRWWVHWVVKKRAAKTRVGNKTMMSDES